MTYWLRLLSEALAGLALTYCVVVGLLLLGGMG